MALQLIKFIAKKIQAIFNDELNCTPQVMYEVLTEEIIWAGKRATPCHNEGTDTFLRLLLAIMYMKLIDKKLPKF
ncbi:hypothetical protein QTP88_028845 [Uroleucon formosanum]